MTSQLPVEKVTKCQEIVEYFERKKEEYSHLQSHFFAEEASSVQLLVNDFYLKLNQLLSLTTGLSIDDISKHHPRS